MSATGQDETGAIETVGRPGLQAWKVADGSGRVVLSDEDSKEAFRESERWIGGLLVEVRA